MNNKKRVINLEYFREMLHICPRIPNQTFDELSFKEEILAFLRYLGHNRDIKKITDVNTNKLHQPWRSFAAVINKCLSGKSTSYNSLRLSQAQILRGMYHKKNVDFAYLLWEDSVYQVEHKDAKKSNEMYYPRFTKVIINSFMTKDPSIPRRNKFGAMLPIELTNEDIKNSTAYKEYYAIASGAAPPKIKASVRKTKSSSDTTMPPPMAAGRRISTSAKGKQPAKSSKAKDDDDDVDDQEDEDEQDDDDQDDNDDDQDSDNEDDDFVHTKLSTHDEEAKDKESFDLIVQTPSQVENSDDESNDDERHGMNVGGDEGPDAEDDEELYRDVNINLEGRDVQMTDIHTTQVLEDTHVTLTPVNPDGQQQSSSVSSQFVRSMFNPSPDAGIDSLFESTPRVDVPVTTTVVPLLVTAPTLHPPSIPIMSQVQQAPTPTSTTAPSTFLQDLPNFGSLFGFDHRLTTLEANFSKFMQTNQFVKFVSSIHGIVDRYIDYRMNEAVKLAIIKEQVSKILPKIKKTVNEQLEAKVLTQSSNSLKTSYVVATDLSELELKKVLIKKMKNNKSIHRSDEQRNLYKALVDAYECDKIILDTYKDTVTLKRRHNDADKDEEPSAGSNGGPREEKKEKSQTTYESIQPWISDLTKQADSRASFNELMDTPVDFSTFLMNRFNVDTLTPKLLAGPTYELMKGSCKSLVELKFFLDEVYKATANQLDWNNPEGQQYPHNLLKPLPLIPNSRGVESYQNKLNLTNPNTYRSDLKRKEAYIPYSNTRGFIYQNKDKQNRLMRIDELHKFSDGALNDVRTALNDRLKGIRMKYLPQTI
nr:hypothetical protein [Tanacetum cinerariifolium]